MKLIAYLLTAFALCAQTATAPVQTLIVNDPVTRRTVVIEPSRIYLLNQTGQVFAIISESVTGTPRGIIAVYNPSTGANIQLDPDRGIVIDGYRVVPMEH